MWYDKGQGQKGKDDREMPLEWILLFIITGLLAVVLILSMIQVRSIARLGNAEKQLERLRSELEDQQRALRQELSTSMQSSIKTLGDLLAANQSTLSEMQAGKFAEIDRHLMEKQEAATQSMMRMMVQLERRFRSFAVENEQKLEQIRGSVEKRLAYLQQDNNVQLEKIRGIVDEKLQKTLEEKMTQSFRLVNDRLEQVYKGLGEMQNLAVGVGDLKKVLSNVKTRGILGEIQLGAILDEILSPEQYETNVATKKGSKNVVEYAIRLPAEDGGVVYLPVDSKFPGDIYARLRDAYDSGSAEQVTEAAKALTAVIRSEAKDIRDKYIDPPNTTEFAILFLPFEGLYAEVVNRGLIEVLQRDYKVNVAGPSTMAALLNSLQMGFRSFAIQKRSGEVWSVLGAVKTEFDKFAAALSLTQQRLEQANDELDRLVGVRTRQMQRKLKDVTRLDERQADELLLQNIEEKIVEDD